MFVIGGIGLFGKFIVDLFEEVDCGLEWVFCVVGVIWL